MNENETDEYQYKLPLAEEVNNLQQESRMILPGIQTLFGFQLIAVFNSNFKTVLTLSEQYIHLVSLILVVFSGILLTAPVAYHRQAKHHVSVHFIRLGSRFLEMALTPLAVGTCMDIYIVAKIITTSIPIAILIALLLFCMYLGIWFIYPRIRSKNT
jgi:hypothetical protein